MDELRYRYYVITLVAGGITAGLCCALSLWTPQNSGEVASWVQAFGAIIGIGIAVYVPWKQRRDALRLERSLYFRARIDAAEKVELVAFELYAYLQDAVKRSTNEGNGHLVFQIGHTKGEELQLRLLKLHDFPFADLDEDVLDLRKTLDEALAVHGSVGYVSIPPGQDPNALPFIRLRDAVQAVRDRLDGYKSGTWDILHRLDSQSYPLVVLVSNTEG